MDSKTNVKVTHQVDVADFDEKADFPALLEPILEVTVRDKDGKVVEHWEKKSESLVRQWLELLYVQASGMQWPGYPVRDTGNNVRQVIADENNFRSDAGAGNSAYSIQIGTGTTSPTIDDYKLETQIAHGLAAGELQYSNTAIAYPAVSLSISQVTVTRHFSNGSGGTVTVYEIGLVLYALDSSHAGRYFMVIRDVIVTGISVADGQTLTINYRLQATA